MRAIGIAGTAKNTGKTTALTAVLRAAEQRGLRTAITSIGYDGEEFDHITGLPKPRVTVTEGMLVATAVGTLRGATAGVERVGQTGVLTTLGEVVLVRVVKPGLIPLAGPPTGPGVTRVVQALAAFGPDLCMVDGAFGRMAPFCVLDGLILATGGARSREIRRLAAETAALAWVFGLPVLPEPPGAARVANLLSESAARAFLTENAPTAGMLLEGAVTVAALDVLAGWDGWGAGVCCTFADPIRLALAGEPLQVRSALERLSEKAQLGVARRVTLQAVTINPFFPDQGGQVASSTGTRPSGGGEFRASYLDAGALRAAVEAAVDAPVVDVQVDGADRILRLICDEPLCIE